jgi:hypothetical protein
MSIDLKHERIKKPAEAGFDQAMRIMRLRIAQRHNPN